MRQFTATRTTAVEVAATDNPVNLIDPTGHDAESSGGDDSQYVFTYGAWYRKSVKYEDQTPPAPDDGLWTKVWVTTTEWARSYTKWDKTDYTPVESGEDPWHGEYRVEVDFEQVNGVWQQSGNVRVTGSLMPAGADDPDSGPTREELEQQARDKADQIIKETVGQAPVPDGTVGDVGNNPVNYSDPTGHYAGNPKMVLNDENDSAPKGCTMCGHTWSNGPSVGATGALAQYNDAAPDWSGSIHMAVGEGTVQGTVPMGGFGGEVDALHMSVTAVPTYILKNGKPIVGLGVGMDAKVLGAEANAGIVDGSFKLGAQAYGLKEESQAILRISTLQITFAGEVCAMCAGAGVSVGKEFSGFIAAGEGIGFTVRFDRIEPR